MSNKWVIAFNQPGDYRSATLSFGSGLEAYIVQDMPADVPVPNAWHATWGAPRESATPLLTASFYGSLDDAQTLFEAQIAMYLRTALALVTP